MGKLSKKQAEARNRQILDLLYEGQKPLEIQDAIGLDGEAFDLAMREILESLSKGFTERPTEHTYADYFIQQTALIRKLEKEAESAQARDAVSALKAIADIRKDLLKVAKEYGIVSPNNYTQGDTGINLTFIQGMSNDEIRKNLFEMLENFKQLDKKFGDFNMIDVPNGELFSGQSVFELQNTKDTDAKGS